MNFDWDGAACTQKDKNEHGSYQVAVCGSKKLTGEVASIGTGNHLVTDGNFLYSLRKTGCELNRFEKETGEMSDFSKEDGKKLHEEKELEAAASDCEDVFFQGKLYILRMNGAVYRLENGKVQPIENREVPSLLPFSAKLKCTGDRLYASVGPDLYAYDGSHWIQRWNVEEGKYFATREVSEITSYDGKLYISVVDHGDGKTDTLVATDLSSNKVTPIPLPVPEAVSSIGVEQNTLVVNLKNSGVYKRVADHWELVPISSQTH